MWCHCETSGWRPPHKSAFAALMKQITQHAAAVVRIKMFAQVAAQDGELHIEVGCA